jgi:hypothetical protein
VRKCRREPAPPVAGDDTAVAKHLEDLSGGYIYDVWSLAYLIARERGPSVQRTIEDVNEADRRLRSGFRRKRAGRRIVGLALNTVGSIAAASGATLLWTSQQGSLLFSIGFWGLPLGVLAAFIGIWIAYARD